MKGSSRRPEQVAETIRQVVAEALIGGALRDPRVGFVTVTGVQVTNDLGHATIRVAPAGDEADRVRALEGLQSAAGFLRSRVAKVLSTRVVPELHLELDRGAEYASRINALIEGLHPPAGGSEGGSAAE